MICFDKRKWVISLVGGLAHGAHALETVVLEQGLATLLGRQGAVLDEANVELLANLDIAGGNNRKLVVVLGEGNLGVRLT